MAMPSCRRTWACCGWSRPLLCWLWCAMRLPRRVRVFMRHDDGVPDFPPKPEQELLYGCCVDVWIVPGGVCGVCRGRLPRARRRRARTGVLTGAGCRDPPAAAAVPEEGAHARVPAHEGALVMHRLFSQAAEIEAFTSHFVFCVGFSRLLQFVRACVMCAWPSMTPPTCSSSGRSPIASSATRGTGPPDVLCCAGARDRVRAGPQLSATWYSSRRSCSCS